MRSSWGFLAALPLALGACGAGTNSGATATATPQAAPIPSAPTKHDSGGSASKSKEWSYPFRIEDLDEWPVPEGIDASTGPDVVLHVADYPADAIAQLVDDSRTTVLRRSISTRVSGRISARRSKVLAALEIAAPGLGENRADLIRPGGRGRAVSLQFSAADPRDLLRLLADVGGINIVLPPGAYADVTISVWAKPWDSLLEAVAKALKLRVHRTGNLVFLGDRAPEIPALAAKRALIDLSAVDAPAASLVALINELGGTRFGLPCSAKNVSLRLRRVTNAQAAAAVAFAAGTSLGNVPRCSEIQRNNPPKLGQDDKLLAIAFQGAKRRAMVRSAAGKTAFYKKVKGVQMGVGYLKVDDELLELDPEHPSPKQDRTRLSKARLAATLVDGSKSLAVIEDPDGTQLVLQKTEHPETLEVTPGQMTFTDAAGKVTTLTIQPRRR